MASLFDQYLFQKDGQWRWRLPENFNIAEACVRRHVDQGQGEKIAMIIEDHFDGTSQLNYNALDDLSARFAGLLGKLGLTSSERVLIRLPNSAEYPVSFFGCLRFGAVAVPTSTLLAPTEVAYLAKDSAAKILVTDKDMWPKLSEVLQKDCNLEKVLLTGDGAMPDAPSDSPVELIELKTALSKTEPQANIANTRPSDPAYLVYTSGTTGYPKGVLHGHRSLIGRLPASRYWFDFKPGDKVMHSGKFNWTYVLGSALMDPLFHGHTVVVHEGPNDASTWPQLIQKHGCTIFIGVPTIYRQIIQKTDFSGNDLPSLRHCMSAGEHLSDEMLLAWRERFGQDVYEAIGMSEFSYYISQHKQQPIRPGAAGFAQPGHGIKLLNAESQPVTQNEEGMIAIPLDDPGLFLSYWQLPDATSAACHDGFFHTGDYARVDSDGYYWFIGRKDDIINSFGYRISPHEIERAIKTHPAVADCVALGEEISPGKVLVSVCVITAEGCRLNESDLLAFGVANLAKYKAPKIVHFYQEFPRTKNGKVLRKQLNAELQLKRQQNQSKEAV